METQRRELKTCKLKLQIEISRLAGTCDDFRSLWLRSNLHASRRKVPGSSLEAGISRCVKFLGISHNKKHTQIMLYSTHVTTKEPTEAISEQFQIY